jgi:hypothetical protein
VHWACAAEADNVVSNKIPERANALDLTPAQYTKLIRPIMTKARQYATVKRCDRRYIIARLCGMRALQPWLISGPNCAAVCYVSNRMRSFRDRFFALKTITGFLF